MSKTKEIKELFAVGSRVHHKDHGNGFCRKVDLGDKILTYLFKFSDGTLVWMDQKTASESVMPGHKTKSVVKAS